MRLSWNEIRARAARFAQGWKDAGYEKGQTQLFYRDFFDIFDVPVRRVAAFEEPVKLLGDSAALSTCSGKASCSSSRKAPAAISPPPRPRPSPTSPASRMPTCRATSC